MKLIALNTIAKFAEHNGFTKVSPQHWEKQCSLGTIYIQVEFNSCFLILKGVDMNSEVIVLRKHIGNINYKPCTICQWLDSKLKALLYEAIRIEVFKDEREEWLANKNI